MAEWKKRLSFNRLAHALVGYGGPTVLLLEDDLGGVFGVFCAAPWLQGNGFKGGVRVSESPHGTFAS